MSELFDFCIDLTDLIDPIDPNNCPFNHIDPNNCPFDPVDLYELINHIFAQFLISQP